MAGSEDGSAVIGVDLDVSDANKELGRLKKRIEKTVQDIADFSRKQEESWKRQIAIDGELDAKKARLQVLENKSLFSIYPIIPVRGIIGMGGGRGNEEKLSKRYQQGTI